MPIRFVGNQGLQTDFDTSPGGATVASFQGWVKLNNVSPAGGVIFGKQFTSPFCFLPQGASGSSLEVRLMLTAGGGIYEARPKLLTGVVYHLAGRYDGATMAFFVNGFQVATSTVSAALNTINNKWQVGSFGGSFDFVVGDICFWTGYAITNQDVADLRNRVKTPTAVGSASQRRICWSLDGPAGQEVALGQDGISGGTIGAAKTLVGKPTYASDVLMYTPPARVKSAYVGESRKTVVFTFESTSGESTSLTEVRTHPSLSLEGAAPVPLGSPPPIWTPGYAIYPLPFSVPMDASLTATSAENWVNTLAGFTGPMDAVPINTGGTPMFTRTANAPKTMELGINVRGPEYWDPVPVYANLAKQGNGGLSAVTGSPSIELDSDMYPTTLSGGEAGFLNHAYLGSGIGSPDKGYVNLGAGPVTVMWDGADQVRIVGYGNVLTQTSYTRTRGQDNVRVYNNTLSASQYYSHVQVVLDGPSVRNIRLYGPGLPEGWSSRFHPEFLGKATGARVVRFLDALEANISNVSTFSRFTPRSRRSYGGSTKGSTATIQTAAPYTGTPANYFIAGRLPFTCTTSAPHGLSTGEIIRFQSPLDRLVLTDGSTVGIPNDHPSQVFVHSPTTFTASIYTGNTKTVAASQQFRASAFTPVSGQMPLEDVAELCAELDADPWITVPHALDDAGIRQMADVFAAKMAPGRRLYVEYSNECWHYSLSFLQTEYCDGRGATEGISGRQWYAKRTSQVHAIFTAAFLAAGRRASDIVRVYATQSANPGITSQILSYAKAQGYPVDALACAPYFGNAPTGFASTYDALDVDQLLDVSALAVSSYPVAELALQKAAMAPHYPEARLVCYEGAMELGVPSYTNLTAAETKCRAWSRHPRILEQTLRYIQNMQDAGCDLFCWFEMNMYHYSRSTWGVYPASWNMQDGLGDGSDGKFDNRTNYDDLPRIVSVIGAALKRWYGWLPIRERPTEPEKEKEVSSAKARPFAPALFARYRTRGRMGR